MKKMTDETKAVIVSATMALCVIIGFVVGAEEPKLGFSIVIFASAFFAMVLYYSGKFERQERELKKARERLKKQSQEYSRSIRKEN